MKQFKFYWSPEGRLLLTVTAANLNQAKAIFKRDCPTYAKYMGEVYWKQQ